jgi:uncharacterized protein CbrC (UPF0167 family)
MVTQQTPRIRKISQWKNQPCPWCISPESQPQAKRFASRFRNNVVANIPDERPAVIENSFILEGEISHKYVQESLYDQRHLTGWLSIVCQEK